jgi:MGT family glycosyltransferase
MSRFLFHSLALTGHVNPIAAVAGAVADRGHDVAWVGSEAFLRPVLPDGTTIYPTGMRLYRGLMRDRGMSATKSRWEGYIVPHARFTLPTVEQAVLDFAPDVLAVDQHAVSGAVLAHRHDLPWMTLAPTSMELTRPYRALPRVEAWIHGHLKTLWTEAGLPGAPAHDLRFSPHGTIAFTTAGLAGPGPFGGNIHFVGAALGRRREDVTFGWSALDHRRKLVLVTVGTLSFDACEDFYRRTIEALRPLSDRVQAIIVAPDGALADLPPHVLAVPQVPMLELMPHLDAVVSHGGLNTVCEALAHGVPLVIAPIKGDQPINAERVVAVGAGRCVRFVRERPDRIRAAIVGVLHDPRHRHAAANLRGENDAAGGAGAAAQHLERLARSAVVEY